MKKNLFVILLLFPLVSFGQKNGVFTPSVDGYALTTEVIKLDKSTFVNEKQILNYLQNTLYPGNKFQLIHKKNSLKQKHYTFQQLFKGTPIYQAKIYFSTTLSGTPTHIRSAAVKINNPSSSIPSNQGNGKDYVWIYSDNTLVLAIKSIKKLEDFSVIEIVQGLNTDILIESEISSHFHFTDTLAQATVFAPDPITSANTNYGGVFVNNNNATNSQLNAQMDTVDLDVTFENGLFVLENEVMKIVELDLPLTTPTTSTNGQFLYNRSDTSFEDVNAFFHITQHHQFIRSLGFMDLMNYQIHIDCHGLNGSDNSVFVPTTNPPTIIFGVGGVDDAEDADVLIHEYSHAVSNSASGNTNFGTQRKTLDEANGDYFAASYSKLYDYYQYNWVYNWDGHNEFWNGRKTISNAIYPNDLANNIYTDAPIWSSALMRIENNIGRNKTNTILLESMHSYFANMSLADAANLFLASDSLLYDKDHYAPICYTFLDKGLVQSCSVPRPPNLLSVPHAKSLNSFTIKNAYNFALGESALEVDFHHPFDICVYNIAGEIVYQQKNIQKHISLDPNQFLKGIYILQLKSNQNVQTTKLQIF